MRGVIDLANPVIRFLTDRIRHQFVVKVNGEITFEVALDYREEFIRRINEINVEDFILILDCEKQYPVSNEVINIFKGILLLYREVPFKQKYAVLMESPVARRQIMALGKEELVNAIHWVHSREEIEEAIAASSGRENV